MGLAFSTEGRVSFRVTVEPTTVGLGRFANAVFRTGARVSHAEKYTSKAMRAVVWLFPTKIPQFESLCLPTRFQLVSNRDLIQGGEPEEPEE